MWRVALVLVLLTASSSVAGDLPPGALARLGDNSLRAGGKIEHLAISPDGKQIATTYRFDITTLSLIIWDADTGCVIRQQSVNHELFKGFVWSPGGASAIVIRADPQQQDKRATGFPDDFRVWDFTNPKAQSPPFFPTPSNQMGGARIDVEWPDDGAKYSDFFFSADGKRVAACWRSANKYAVHVFELKPTNTATKLNRVGTIDLGAEAVWGDEIRISADGKTVVTFRWLANGGATATMWNVATGKPAKPVSVPVSQGDNLMVSPDARSLVTLLTGVDEWGYDRHDLSTGKQSELIRRKYDPQHPDRPLPGAFAFTSSGDGLAVVINDHVSVLDLTTAKERGRLEGHTSAPTAIAISADGARIVTTDEYGLIRVWDAKTLRPVHEVTGHRAPVESAELSPDGKRLLTWAPDKTMRLWEVATGAELRAFTGSDPTFTPDGTGILFSTADRLMARDFQTGLEVPLPGDMKKLEPSTAIFSPDGKSVLTCGRLTCEMWEWPSGKKRFTWKPAATPGEFEPGFSPDGSAIFEHPTSPKRYDAKTGKELPPAKVDDGVKIKDTTYALSPRGGVSASWRWEQPNEICLYESASGQVRRVFTGHRGDVQILGFTPDGMKLLTAGGDHTVLVWDVRLQNVPLPDAIKKETNAAKLWDTLATGKADAAYLAMARLAREPDTAVKMAKMRLKPAAKGDRESDTSNLTDARAVELLEALDTADARALLKELAAGHADAFRTQEAKRALERHK